MIFHHSTRLGTKHPSFPTFVSNPCALFKFHANNLPLFRNCIRNKWATIESDTYSMTRMPSLLNILCTTVYFYSGSPALEGPLIISLLSPSSHNSVSKSLHCIVCSESAILYQQDGQPNTQMSHLQYYLGQKMTEVQLLSPALLMYEGIDWS